MKILPFPPCMRPHASTAMKRMTSAYACRLLAATATALVLATPPQAQANLLVNGSFESYAVVGEYGLITTGNPSSELPGWNVPHEVYWLYRNYQITAQDGNQWFGPQASDSALASQDFPVVAGTTYEVSWYSQYRSGYVGTGTAAITLAAGAATGTTTMTTAEDASWTRYSFSFTPDTTTTATLTLSAASGIPYFDNVAVTDGINTINTWYVNSTESWSGPRQVTGDWIVGHINAGILNHTGGTITDTTPWAFIIGQDGAGAYHMSGNAGVITTGGTDTRVLIGNLNQGTWSMIDNSTATIGQLIFRSPGDDTLLLSGNASVNAEGFDFASAGSDCISIASGAAATLTVVGKVLSDYQSYVSAGNIRVDGVVQADFSKFVVTGNTLSLAPTISYASWASSNGVAGGADEDSDNDGVDNGVEYFMGITSSDPVFTANPGLNSPNAISWPVSATFSGNYEVETSPNLSAWTPVSPKPVPSGGFLNYTLPAGAPGGKSFVRLVVVPD